MAMPWRIMVILRSKQFEEHNSSLHYLNLILNKISVKPIQHNEYSICTYFHD